MQHSYRKSTQHREEKRERAGSRDSGISAGLQKGFSNLNIAFGQM